jgi:Immunoglobulin I-set domain
MHSFHSHLKRSRSTQRLISVPYLFAEAERNQLTAKMNRHTLIAALLAVAVVMVGGRRLPIEVDNAIDGGHALSQGKDWVEVSRSPPTRVAKHKGHSLELECEVIGQPTPSVHWVHGSAQLRNVRTT